MATKTQAGIVIPTDILLKVYRFFEYDFTKTNLWFNTDNPMLGNVSPIQMVLMGRVEKLREFVNDAEFLAKEANGL